MMTPRTTEPIKQDQFPPAPAVAKCFRPPQPGAVITFRDKQYTVGPLIGEGGFGQVFQCTDDWHNSLVAKVIVPKGRTYEQVRDCWLRELRNLVELRHPNITFVYDAFECDDTFYIIVEQCSQTMTSLIQWPKLKPELWIMPIAKCILQAIHFIHSRGYIHKDIHPGNVFTHYVFDEMIGAKQSAVVFQLGDLGISRLLPEMDVFNTLLAQWMLPPEALAPNDFGALSTQVDVYHFGLLLLSLLQKKIPSFSQDEILEGKPRVEAEELNHKFSPAIAKALRRHVLQRTQTALEFWYDLVECNRASPILPSISNSAPIDGNPSVAK
jgi:serine/threonine protein kinase